jgi:hypothetical protein
MIAHRSLSRRAPSSQSGAPAPWDPVTPPPKLNIQAGSWSAPRSDSKLAVPSATELVWIRVGLGDCPLPALSSLKACPAVIS